MKQFIKLADADKIQSDLENEIIQLLNEKFLDQKKPGESFSDWLKRTPKEELLKLELSGGGKVIMLSDYLKQKENHQLKNRFSTRRFEKQPLGYQVLTKILSKIF